jgi:hypothetical protein
MSLLGTFGHAILGGIEGFATGGPVGAVRGALGSFTQGGGGPPMAAMPAAPSGGGPFTIGGTVATPIARVSGGLSFGGTPSTSPAGGMCPKGYHLNKHALSASKRHGALAARSTCVRNRHMHPLNSRAIVHSLRRLKRASKIVRKLHAFSGARRAAPRASGHRAGCNCVVCRRR